MSESANAVSQAVVPNIRKLRPEDRAQLEATLHSDAVFAADEIAVALELIDHSLAHGEVDYSVRVAELVPGQIAGFVCFGRTPMTQNTYDLYWVVTHAQARGRGVAKALFTAFESELAGRAAQVRIETGEKEGHGAARALYERMGYSLMARLPNFYAQGDGLLIYFKELR